MADLSERERVLFKQIEDTKAKLGKKDDELKEVDAKIERELEKTQPRQDLLANWKETRGVLRQQWTSLDAELQGFQGLLAAGGMCLLGSYGIIFASGCDSNAFWLTTSIIG